MTTQVSVVVTCAWDVQAGVSAVQMTAWNTGLPFQSNMSQMATVAWISTYPS